MSIIAHQETLIESREAREQSDTLIAEYNKLFNDKFNFKFIGAQSLYDLIQQRERNDKVVSEKISYEFHQDAANMLDYYIKDFNGVICSVRGEEIARLVENNGDNLFEANIRKFLGDNKVNMAILDTCKSESNSQFFWFFNNGITIVCEDFKVLRNPKILTQKSVMLKLLMDVKPQQRYLTLGEMVS